MWSRWESLSPTPFGVVIHDSAIGLLFGTCLCLRVTRCVITLLAYARWFECHFWLIWAVWCTMLVEWSRSDRLIYDEIRQNEYWSMITCSDIWALKSYCSVPKCSSHTAWIFLCERVCVKKWAVYTEISGWWIIYLHPRKALTLTGHVIIHAYSEFLLRIQKVRVSFLSRLELILALRRFRHPIKKQWPIGWGRVVAWIALSLVIWLNH